MSSDMSEDEFPTHKTLGLEMRRDMYSNAIATSQMVLVNALPTN